MATGSYGIANVKDITSNFSITLSSQSALCPTYSLITSNSSLGVSGATYASNQLVLYKHIYRRAAATNYNLTISNLSNFLSAMGYEDENGYWELYFDGSKYDGGGYPTSYLQYNAENFIEGTEEEWTAFYEQVDSGDYWDNVELQNSETEESFSLSDYSRTGLKTVIRNLASGSDQTILLEVPSAPTVSSAVINLNNEWATGSTNPSPTTYYSFESAQSKGVDSSGDYIYLKIKGYTTYTLYIRSNGEKYFDYVMVSKPDMSISHTTSYNNANVYAHTYGKASSGTSLSSYTTVTFTGLTTAEHTITIVYRKDSSGEDGTDTGYVLIPRGNNVSYQNMYTTSPSTTNSKTITFGIYDADLVREIDMGVTVTIYSNNGQTYTQSCRVAGGSNNGASEDTFIYGCSIPIQYTGTTPTDITYKYTLDNYSTTSDCYFDFVEYYNGTRSADREGFFVDGTTIKESDNTNYVATEIPFDSSFFTASDARLELYFHSR